MSTSLPEIDDKYYLHCLNLFSGFGPQRLALLKAAFPSWQAAFTGSAAAMTEAGIPREIVKQFQEFRLKLHPEQEAERLQTLGISLLSQNDHSYPQQLREISVPPMILYYKGRLPPADSLMLAVVGTRKITTYGQTIIPRLVGPLAEAGLIVVSGLAFGVDAACHEEALRKNASTLAVLGSGLDDDSLYPKNHCLLAQRIIDSRGCLLSEYPPGSPALKQNFVSRNRIIAGLSLGVLVIECGLKSGSLITAMSALNENRRVYAVPGSIYAEESAGTNNLIKMGASLVTDSSDILSDLNVQAVTYSGPSDTSELGARDKLILEHLASEPITTDRLILATGLEAQQVITTLAFLEIKGRVKNLGASQYVKIR